MIKDCWDYFLYRLRDILYGRKRSVRRKKKGRRYLLQKAAVVIAGILWFITAARVFWSTGTAGQQQKVISAFGSASYREVYADITAYGKYGTGELTDTAKKIILERAAEKIGISNYSVETSEEGAKQVITLSQYGENGDVICRFVTLRQEDVEYGQYLYVGITLKNAVDASFTYEKIVRELMKEMQIDTQVNVNLRGELTGAFTQAQKEQLAQFMLDKMDAKLSVSRQMDDAYTVYAYDKKLDDYIMLGNEKINVNICINYNEDENVTTVYLATPVNIQDY